MIQAVRLDVLIYAHDGRGLGHASRSIGVGMALRRLYPELKVLFVSGCNMSQDLIGRAPLDWVKLPSYATKVIDGRSVGVPGKTRFSDPQLGLLRSQELVHLVSLYRPRLVLVDHTPQGKHRELIPALTADGGEDTVWLLGVRGVIGAVTQARSELAGNIFRDHYHGLLWYGDCSVLGNSHREQLRHQYSTDPVECGYVLRLAEFSHWNGRGGLEFEEAIAGTVSIPWLGEKTMDFLTVLATVLPRIPRSFGTWRLFIDADSFTPAGQKIRALFGKIDNCRVAPPGGRYTSALLASKTAVIYGGYNSLMDIIFARIPALVVLREMQDEEQQLHLQKLKEAAGEAITTVSETKVSPEELERLLLARLQGDSFVPAALNTSGAENAAHYIQNILS